MSATARAAKFVLLKMTRPIQPPILIRHDFISLGVRLKGCNRTFVACLPEEQYGSLLYRLREFKQVKAYDELLIDPPAKLRDFGFSKLPDDFLVQQIAGKKLDLTDLRAKFARYQIYFPAGKAALLQPDRRAILPPADRPPVAPISLDEPLPDGGGPPLDIYNFVSGLSVMERVRGFELGTIPNPAKLPPQIKADLVDGLNWLGRDRGDMAEHLVNVDETVIAFRKHQPVAFASVDELTYVQTDERGRKHNAKITPLVGTAVRDIYRRQGLQVRMNYGLLVKRWLRFKLTVGLFQPFRVGVRTRSRIVIATLYRHFQDVKFRDLAAGEREAQAVMAQHYKCQIDADGLVRNAYEKTIGNETNGRFPPRLARRIDQALDGLGENDARIFIGKITAFGFFKNVVWNWLKSIGRF